MHRHPSRKIANHALLITLLTLSLPFAADAQMVNVDACTLPLGGLDIPEELKNALQTALDAFLNGACTSHDLCYRLCIETCTGSNGLSAITYAQKTSCDAGFAAALIDWCGDRGADLVGAEHAGTLLAWCQAAVPAAVFITSALAQAFEDVQCNQCGNCPSLQLPDPLAPAWLICPAGTFPFLDCPGGFEHPHDES